MLRRRQPRRRNEVLSHGFGMDGGLWLDRAIDTERNDW
jgi:hypothetical protein